MQTPTALLDADQEHHLARLVEAGLYAQHLLEAGDPRPGLAAVAAQGRDAWQHLMLANTGMVKALARRYGRGRRDIEEDLVQEGFVALSEALMRFDWTRGLRLSTQAWHWVKHAMVASMRRRSGWEASTSAIPDELPLAAPEPEEDEGVAIAPLLQALTVQERNVLLARASGLPQQVAARSLNMGLSTLRRVEQRALRRARAFHLDGHNGTHALVPEVAPVRRAAE